MSPQQEYTKRAYKRMSGIMKTAQREDEARATARRASGRMWA